MTVEGTVPRDDVPELGHSVPSLMQGSEQPEGKENDEEAATQLAAGDGAGMVHGGTRRAYRSFEEMFNDPASPVGTSVTTWHDSASSPEEIAASFGVMANLALKVTQVELENRLDAASASWHAVHRP